MTQPVLDMLTERGKAFQKVALGHHYLQYEKFMHFRHRFGVNYIKVAIFKTGNVVREN